MRMHRGKRGALLSRASGRKPISESGASAVEFALVVPILIALVSGIITFGIVMAQQVALGNAARQAARSAVVSGVTCGTTGTAGSGLRRQAQIDSTTIWLNPDSVQVDVQRASARPSDNAWGNSCTGSGVAPCAGSTLGDNVYVRLRYTSTLQMPFVQPSFNLTGVGAFRCEFS